MEHFEMHHLLQLANCSKIQPQALYIKFSQFVQKAFHALKSTKNSRVPSDT